MDGNAVSMTRVETASLVPSNMSRCPMCDGRPRVITYPQRGGNRYRIAANKGRKKVGRALRTRGGAFRQVCGVCHGTGLVHARPERFVPQQDERDESETA